MRQAVVRRIVETVRQYPRMFAKFYFGETEIPVSSPNFNFENLSNEDLLLLFEQVCKELYQQ